MSSLDHIEVRGARENNLRDMGPGPGHDGGAIVFAGPPRAAA